MNHPEPIHTDALIIGAGPVGLWQAFQLGLQGIRVHLVDALNQPGGQCQQLYPDKPIYDIPALPLATGQQLVARLWTQLRPFNPSFHGSQLVQTLAVQADGFFVTTQDHLAFQARCVFIAAGVGAFVARQLPLPDLQPLHGTAVLDIAPDPEQLEGQHVLVAGSSDEAVQTALHLATGPARSVGLLHRRAQLDASEAVRLALDQLIALGRINLHIGQLVGASLVDGRLHSVDLLGVDGTTRVLPTHTVVQQLGLSPKLGPVAHWGLDMARKQLLVDTAKFETSVPGIYAVGDVNTYPGKQKLILCGFHEATLAAFAAAQRVYPGRHIPLQYTTTSTHLQQLLGVANLPTNTP